MRRLMACGVLVFVFVIAGCGSSPKRSVRTSLPPPPSKTAPAKPATAGATTATAPAQPPRPPGAGEPGQPRFGIGNVRGCLGGSDPVPYLRRYRATLLRVIVTPLWGGLGSNGEALSCLRDAQAAGYQVHLVIQYSNVWSTAQTAAYFRQVLTYYGQFAWAVSIGNEQELFQGGTGRTGRQYAQVWHAVEPIVAELAPQAIRVAGEISPWGLRFLKRAVRAGLPGAQVLAAHVYAYRFHFRLPAFEAWARSLAKPYWFTEGAFVAGSRSPALPVSKLAGAPVIEGWLNY